MFDISIAYKTIKTDIKRLIAYIIAVVVILNLSACQSLSTKPSYNQNQLDSILDSQYYGNLAYQNEEWQQAIGYYESLVEQYPNHGNSWFRLGNCYSTLGYTEKALRAYDRALEADPENSKAWHNKGMLQLKIATDTFLKMQEHTVKPDEYSARGRFVVDSIENILKRDFTTRIEDE